MLITYAYDPLSRRDSATRSSVNGATTDYTFDNASRLTTLAHDFSGGATNDQSYGFTYTAASQLQQRTASNDNYTWPISAIDRAYNRNGLNQYTTTTGTGATTFTHDARGNLISDGVRRFRYDLENRLLRVDDHADTSCSTPALTLSYDPLGRLHQSSDGTNTRQFLYDGDALIAEYEGNGIVRRFVHGPGVDEPVVQYDGSGLNTRIHLFADRQGSIIATNGATTNTYRYGPYGETDVWAGSRFRYTGQAVLDPNLGTSTPVALYHYKARVYDPVLGRFLQTDPIGYEDDLNLYQYVGNDALNSSDPSGMESGGCSGLGCGVAQGVGARVGYVGVRSEQVRGQYNRGAAGLAANDSAGRTAIKAEARANTPAEVRSRIQAQRPSLGPREGSGGTANRTNASATQAARNMGNLGRASIAVTAVTAGADIATSDDPGRATAANAGAIAGGLAGGKLGAELGMLGGPYAPITSPLGALIGAGVGGYLGYQGGEALYDGAGSGERPQTPQERVNNGILR